MSSEWVLVPRVPTEAMRDALRAGSRRDYPSDELCNVRYVALLAASPAAPEGAVAWVSLPNRRHFRAEPPDDPENWCPLYAAPVSSAPEATEVMVETACVAFYDTAYDAGYWPPYPGLAARSRKQMTLALTAALRARGTTPPSAPPAEKAVLREAAAMLRRLASMPGRDPDDAFDFRACANKLDVESVGLTAALGEP